MGARSDMPFQLIVLHLLHLLTAADESIVLLRLLTAAVGTNATYNSSSLMSVH